MDSRYQAYIKKHLHKVLDKISKMYFPSYELSFSFVWEGEYHSKKFLILRVYFHSNDHRHSFLHKSQVEQLVEALKDYEEEGGIITSIDSISSSIDYITVSFNRQSLVDKISTKV